MTRKRSFLNSPIVVYIIILLLGLYGIIILFRSVRDSTILSRPDRVNVVFYGDEAKLLSFGIADDVNYIVSFSHEDKVAIPGGYDRYVLGSLGRLAEIEEDRYIMQRAFSSMISGYVDYYIYPKDPKVYEKKDTDSPGYTRSELIKTLFSRSYTSNANIIDKAYIAFLVARKRQQDFVVLRSVSDQQEEGPPIYSERNFQKKYKGFFFHQSLREEGREVQIKYHIYGSAVTLSRVIEGQGIRIVDLSFTDKEVGRCLIQHQLKDSSPTVSFLARTFDCDIERDETEGVDIILITGNELEEEWE